MKQWIYEKGAIIGSFEVSHCGLYDEYTCEIHAKGEKIRRLYAVDGFFSHYLGIPDGRGRLVKKLKHKLLPQSASCLLSSDDEKSCWCPWRGVLDGVVVEDVLLCREEECILLALLPEEAMQFPAWTDHFQETNIFNQTRMLLQLKADGQLPVIERKNRRDKDEKDENFVGFADTLLHPDSDPCAGQCAGDQGQGRQTDCADL